MPELFLGNRALLLDRAPLHYRRLFRVLILAHMHIPAEPELRQALIAACVGTTLDGIQHCIQSARASSSPEDLKKIARLRKCKRDLTTNFYVPSGRHQNITMALFQGPVLNKTRLMKGATTGLMLFTMASLTAFGYAEKHGVSKSKAEFLIEKIAKKLPNTKGVYRDRAAMERAWSEYRSSSHLWASWYYLALQIANERGHYQTPSQILQLLPLRTFLETASYFQSFLTNWVPHGSSAPLLSEENVWPLPPDLPLYGPAIDLRAHGKHITEELKTYQASRG